MMRNIGTTAFKHTENAVIFRPSSEAYALALGKTYAHYNRYRSVPDIINAIQQVKAEEMQEVAQEVYQAERLTTLMYV